MYGGEDADPFEYGRVLISLVDTDGFDLTERQEREISDFVSSSQPLASLKIVT